MAKVTQSKALTDAVAALAKQLVADVHVSESPDEIKAARNAKKNDEGGMLMCTFNLAKRIGQPDPLCVTINDEVRWVKRGATVTVPWYLVEHMLHNIERKYRREKQADGSSLIVFDDMLTEQFQYREIKPGIDEATGKPFECEGPKAPPTQQPY